MTSLRLFFQSLGISEKKRVSRGDGKGWHACEDGDRVPLRLAAAEVPQLELIVSGGRHYVAGVHPSYVGYCLRVAAHHRQRGLKQTNTWTSLGDDRASPEKPKHYTCANG